MSLRVIILPEGVIVYLPKPHCQAWDSSFWVVSQGSWRDSRNNIGYCCCLGYLQNLKERQYCCIGIISNCILFILMPIDKGSSHLSLKMTLFAADGELIEITVKMQEPWTVGPNHNWHICSTAAAPKDPGTSGRNGGKTVRTRGPGHLLWRCLVCMYHREVAVMKSQNTVCLNKTCIICQSGWGTPYKTSLLCEGN